MRILVIFSLIVFFSSHAFTQQNQLSVGVLGSVDAYNIDFRASDIFLFAQEYETPLGYSVGLQAKYAFANKLFTKAAVQYTTRAYKLTFGYRGVDPGDPVIPDETTTTLNYIGVPLFIGYNLSVGEKLRVAPSVGVVNEFLIADEEKTTFQDGAERASDFIDQDLSMYIASAQYNLTFEYQPFDRWYFSVEPYLRLGFTTIDNTTMESNFMVFGGIFGVNYAF